MTQEDFHDRLGELIMAHNDVQTVDLIQTLSRAIATLVITTDFDGSSNAKMSIAGLSAWSILNEVLQSDPHDDSEPTVQ